MPKTTEPPARHPLVKAPASPEWRRHRELGRALWRELAGWIGYRVPSLADAASSREWADVAPWAVTLDLIVTRLAVKEWTARDAP